MGKMGQMGSSRVTRLSRGPGRTEPASSRVSRVSRGGGGPSHRVRDVLRLARQLRSQLVLVAALIDERANEEGWDADRAQALVADLTAALDNFDA